MKQTILENPICAILRHVPDDLFEPYVKSIYQGGVHMFEVALNTKDAYNQIRRLRKIFGGDALVGAGTVISLERCKKAQDAGAQFFLTPSASQVTLEFCVKHSMPLLPGVMTPTDVATCLEYGFSTLKLFPAGNLQENYIKNLKGPFDETDYVAVGGVTQHNLHRFFRNGFIGVGMGSALVPNNLIEEQRWEHVSNHVAALLASVREAMPSED